MTFLVITGLINAIASTIFGSFVFLKNRKAKINQAFALFCLSVAVWSYAYFFWQIASNATEALIWLRVLMGGAIFIPIFYFHFALRLLDKVVEKKRMLVIGYVFFLFFFLANFTSLFIKGVVSKLGFVFGPEPGILFHPFLALWVFYAGYTVFLLIKAYLTSTGIKHSQIRYIVLGTSIGFLGGGTNYFLWYDIAIPPYGNILVVAYVAAVAYAILKYRLMDIRVAIKRSTVFSAVVIIITAAYVLAAFLLSWAVFGGVYTFRSQIIIGFVVAVITAFGFRPLYEWLKKTTDAFLFKGDYRPEELIAEISDTLSRTLDLGIVIQVLRQEIVQALRVKKIDIFIIGNEKNNNHLKKPSLNKLIEFFKKQRNVLVLEELKRRRSEGFDFDKSFHLIEEMEKMEVALAMPLLIKDKLVGLFLLEPKKSGDAFTNEDIRTLETIAAQAAIAIENARLYEEMKDFSRTLQKEVKRQTKDLRDANIRLQQLDKAKSEFISLASHQLRTPLTAIKGYISMLLEGSWGNIPEKQRDNLEKVYLSNERLINLVEDLLTVSRIESGRLEFELKLISLENLTEDVVSELSQLATKKGVYLKYVKPDEPLPKVRVDSLKIRQVIQNLIDNAIHYTREGGAVIRLKQKKDKIIFSIKDTGVGVSKEEKVVLFEKFSRGKGVSKMHTEGTGLGLYLAARLVKAHKGRIWVESEGKGKGSTFFFELPIKNKKK